nr:MAG TPA: hypothetical protein [Bacteriophage sp.]
MVFSKMIHVLLISWKMVIIRLTILYFQILIGIIGIKQKLLKSINRK